MQFLYGKQQIRDGVRGQESCWLLTNGLGGFSAQTILGSVSRNDHALLMACTQAPNHRWNVVHRLEEQVQGGERQAHLSSQTFPDREEETGRPAPVAVYPVGAERGKGACLGVGAEHGGGALPSL